MKLKHLGGTPPGPTRTLEAVMGTGHAHIFFENFLLACAAVGRGGSP